MAFTEHYKSSIPKYRGRLSTLTHGSDPGEGLGTKLPVKKTFEYPLSIFTRFALLLRDSSFLSKNEFNDKATRSKYLGRGLFKKPRVRGSSLTSSVFLKIILLIKRP